MQNPNASNTELYALVKEAVLDGQTVVLDPSGKLAHSNEVRLGYSGQADGEPPAQGGRDPEGSPRKPKNGT